MRVSTITSLLSLALLVGCEADGTPTSPPAALTQATADATANPDGSCKVRRLRTKKTGQLQTTNCTYDGLGYPAYTDIFRFRPDREFPGYDPDVELSMFSFEVTSDFSGAAGIMENAADPFDGNLLSGLNIAAGGTQTFSLIGDANRYKFFILGGPGETGSYKIRTTQNDPGAFRCGDITAVRAPISFLSRITKNRACSDDFGTGTLRSHQRFVWVPPGATMTVDVERVDPDRDRFRPEIWVLTSDAQVLAADAAPLPDGVTSRQVTFSLPLSYSTGPSRFVMIVVGATRNGEYTFTIS